MVAAASSTILVVDDENSVGDLMSRVLRHLGHHAVHVPGGQEAIDYVREEKPDAILLDYMMPGMDGLAVLRALRDDPRTHGLPVIMFSACNDPNVVDAAMRAGASDYWVKSGLGLSDIERMLSKWLTQPN